VEGESTTVLRPAGSAGYAGDGGENQSQSGDGDPTQLVRGDEPTAPVDDDGQRTQVITPKSEQDDQPTDRWR